MSAARAAAAGGGDRYTDGAPHHRLLPRSSPGPACAAGAARSGMAGAALTSAQRLQFVDEGFCVLEAVLAPPCMLLSKSVL